MTYVGQEWDDDSESRRTPQLVSREARDEFVRLVREMGREPEEKGMGGYVGIEWQRVRWLLESDAFQPEGRQVLEFGSYVGATAIVLASLGAKVHAVDVNLNYLSLAKWNVASYGLEDRVHFHHLPDSSSLPWEDGTFHAIVCNSVLEYVEHRCRFATLRELDRVLKPGGTIFVLGTSNRLWPREFHTGYYLVNYVPRRWCKWQQGLTAYEILRALKGYVNVCVRDGELFYLRAKRLAGLPRLKLGVLRIAANVFRLLAPLGVSIGMLTPFITLILQKPFEQAFKDRARDANSRGYGVTAAEKD